MEQLISVDAILDKKEENITAKNLVFISLTNRMGGAEQMLLMMANTTNSPLIFLKKVANYCLPLKADQKVKYVTNKPLFIGFLMLIKALYPYRKDHVIISSHAYLNAFLGFLKRIGYLQSKLVARESTSLFTRYRGLKRLSYSLAYRLGYPSIGLVICQTKPMRTQLLENNNYLPASKVITLDNAIDLETVKIKGSVNTDVHKAGREFICTAGRLIPIKGFGILIRAFKEIVEKNKNLDLLILGEGAERDYLNKLIKELKLEDRVFLKGHIDNPYPYFRQAKVCVVSSIQEGFPNVLLQMMALNTSVVTTLCAGGIEDIPFIVKVKPDDQHTLLDGIKRALTEDNANNREGIDTYLARRSPQTFVNTILKKIA